MGIRFKPISLDTGGFAPPKSDRRLLPDFMFASGKPSLKGWLIIAAASSASVVALGFLTLFIFVSSVKAPADEEPLPARGATQILDAQGELIGSLRGGYRREVVPMEQIAPTLQQAVVAAEDRNFYRHDGMSYRGVIRAAFANLTSGGVEQGASTITQQYARIAYESVGTERTMGRKLREAAVARKVEEQHTKDEILEFYLNAIYFGRNSYGAEAAAMAYFNKPASQLDLSESAYLAGAIRSPARLQPDRDPQGAVRARNRVLDQMVANRAITPDEAAEAGSQDLLEAFRLTSPGPQEVLGGYFLEFIRRSLLEDSKYGVDSTQVLGGGLRVHTTLDLNTQRAAEAAISSTMDQPTDPEVALIAMKPDGRVTAMVGGRDTHDPKRALGFNFAANVRSDDLSGRQAGSAFKPFALAAFLDEGQSLSRRFSGAGRLQINSRQCRNGDGSAWRVSNYGGSSHGRIDVLRATANSVNTVYAAMMDQVVTPDGFMEMAARTGIDIPDSDRGCALTLGTSDVTPLEMARAYSTFAGRGARPDVTVITLIEDRKGEVLFRAEPEQVQAIDRSVADNVNLALQNVITAGTARSADIGRPAAGKTGTTQNHRDAWFAGYTPDLTAVVWMGYSADASGRIPLMNNVRGVRVTGGSFPATIWSRFMQEALNDVEPTEFARPERGRNQPSGVLAAPARPRTAPEPIDCPDCPPNSEFQQQQQSPPPEAFLQPVAPAPPRRQPSQPAPVPTPAREGLGGVLGGLLGNR